MDDLELKNLEKIVDDLLLMVATLRKENSALHERQETLLLERADLIEKTEEARLRVEAMIGRLKTLEED